MEAKVYFDRYRLHVDPIGLPLVIRRSANEATFKAEDLTEHKNVALQVVPVVALRNVVREQLEAEARTAQKITHINIPQLHDFGLEDGQIIYVTEYFDGTTAENWVQTHGPLPVGAVLRIAQQVVNASSVATFHGIVHHAINPSNIMLVPGQTTEGEWPLIKLLNVVGVAPTLTQSETANPESADPVNFASPEQLQHGEVDFRSQMYSLGATLWFLLTGKAPVGGAAGVEHGGRVPSAVRHLLMQMLAADPGDRPLDPLALQAAIRDCLAHLDRRDVVASKMPLASGATAQVDATRRSFPWKPLALAALLIGAAAVAAVLFAQHSQRQAIGVPVGVPENSSAVAAANTTSTNIVAAPNESNNTPAATEPPVLTSTAEAPATEENETEASAAVASSSNESADESSSAPVAANTASSSPIVETAPSQQMLASNSPVPTSESEEPEPPTEGPDDAAPANETAPVQQENIVAQNERPDATQSIPSPTIAPVEEPAIAAKAEHTEATVKPSPRHVSRQTRVARNRSAEPLTPRGSVRAQYLGTTPQGEMVFGLPSNEKVYASPPRSVREETPAPRRTRRILRSPDENLPVLPALPPDD